MDKFERGFRGRIIPQGEGFKEIPASRDEDNPTIKREKLLKELEEIKKQLDNPGLSTDRLTKLWNEQRKIEKELNPTGEGEDKENPTGVYL